MRGTTIRVANCLLHSTLLPTNPSKSSATCRHVLDFNAMEVDVVGKEGCGEVVLIFLLAGRGALSSRRACPKPAGGEMLCFSSLIVLRTHCPP
eukprot:712068-Pleurochrysis_carterae.AAC.1